jgi:hypothetical protein
MLGYASKRVINLKVKYLFFSKWAAMLRRKYFFGLLQLNRLSVTGQKRLVGKLTSCSRAWYNSLALYYSPQPPIIIIKKPWRKPWLGKKLSFFELETL